MRSKVLLACNIISTLYTGSWLYLLVGALIRAGGINYMEYWISYFDAVLELAQLDTVSVSVITAIIILIFAHVILLTVGILMGWIGYFSKKSGFATFAAVLYLIGTLCLPVSALSGLLIIILGFVGANKQKKLRKREISSPLEQ